MLSQPRIVLALACAFTALLVGCTPQVTSSRYPDAPVFDRRPLDHPIDAFLIEDAPQSLQEALSAYRPLEEVPEGSVGLGSLEIAGLSNWLTSLHTARAQANRWGGDAIVIHGARVGRFNAKPLSRFTYELSAEVIRYIEPADDSEGETK